VGLRAAADSFLEFLTSSESPLGGKTLCAVNLTRFFDFSVEPVVLAPALLHVAFLLI
jgi:hypothetical protein